MKKILFIYILLLEESCKASLDMIDRIVVEHIASLRDNCVNGHEPIYFDLPHGDFTSCKKDNKENDEEKKFQLNFLSNLNSQLSFPNPQIPLPICGKLKIELQNGDNINSIGCLIGNCHVLTAAHCLLTPKGYKARKVTFYLNNDLNGSIVQEEEGIRVHIALGWEIKQEKHLDYAVVILKNPIQKVAIKHQIYYFKETKGGAIKYNSSICVLEGGVLNFVHELNWTLYARCCVLEYIMTILEEGNSGAPIFYGNKLFGIHNQAIKNSQKKQGILFFKEHFKNLNLWRQP